MHTLSGILLLLFLCGYVMALPQMMDEEVTEVRAEETGNRNRTTPGILNFVGQRSIFRTQRENDEDLAPKIPGNRNRTSPEALVYLGQGRFLSGPIGLISTIIRIIRLGGTLLSLMGPITNALGYVIGGIGTSLSSNTHGIESHPVPYSGAQLTEEPSSSPSSHHAHQESPPSQSVPSVPHHHSGHLPVITIPPYYEEGSDGKVHSPEEQEEQPEDMPDEVFLEIMQHNSHNDKF